MTAEERGPARGKTAERALAKRASADRAPADSTPSAPATLPEGDRFLAEILEQPAALRRAGAGVVAQADVLARVADAAASPGSIVLTGMGGSLDACLAAATALAAGGTFATVCSAGELLHFGLPALAGASVLVVVSQSGESAEVVRLADAVRALPARPLVVAVTNGQRTPLADRTDAMLDTCAGEELAPSTKTFGTSLVALSGLVRAILAGRGSGAAGSAADGAAPTGTTGGGRAPGTTDVGALAARTAADADACADAVGRLLADPATAAAALATRLTWERGFVALGRGTGIAAAEMGALILTESVGMATVAHDTGDFRHGPREVAGPGMGVGLVSLDDPTLALDLALADELVDAGAALLVVTRDGVGPAAAYRIATGPLDPMVAPAVAVVPFQLLAWHLATRTRLRPGELLVGSKVTRQE